MFGAGEGRIQRRSNKNQTQILTVGYCPIGRWTLSNPWQRDAVMRYRIRAVPEWCSAMQDRDYVAMLCGSVGMCG
jgi:hypothetical protein